MRTLRKQYEVNRSKMLRKKALAERLNGNSHNEHVNLWLHSDFYTQDSPMPQKGFYPDGETHRYFKGKIHCSCPICSAKSDGRFGKRNRNYKISDQKKIDRINYIE